VVEKGIESTAVATRLGQLVDIVEPARHVAQELEERAGAGALENLLLVHAQDAQRKAEEHLGTLKHEAVPDPVERLRAYRPQSAGCWVCEPWAAASLIASASRTSGGTQSTNAVRNQLNVISERSTPSCSMCRMMRGRFSATSSFNTLPRRRAPPGPAARGAS